jgi:hypothetical protein
VPGLSKSADGVSFELPARAPARGVQNFFSMEDIPMNSEWTLDLEIEDLEAAARPGCNSSSTSPRCTCPVIVAEDPNLA